MWKTRQLVTIWVVILTITVLSGCASDQASGRFASESYQYRGERAEARQRAAQIATEQIGTRYRFGSTGPEAFDCSGLVYFSYAAAGYRVPRSSALQFDATTPVALRDARPGDLLFFRPRFKVSHVGIYLGGGRFVHAPASGKTVSITRLDEPYYRKHFVRAGRLPL